MARPSDVHDLLPVGRIRRFAAIVWFTDSCDHVSGQHHDKSGWTSFAPEPSAFGTVLFLYAAFFAARGRPALAVVALLTTALAAQSALGLVYFAILALAYLLLHITKQARWLLPISAFLILLTVVVDMRDILEILPDGSRVTTLVNHAIVSGSIQEDNSVSSRVSDLISAMSAVTEGSMLGEGFGGEKRLKSGWGAYAYELGWLGLTIAIGWIGYFLFRAKQMGRNVLASTGAIIVMLFRQPLWLCPSRLS